VGAARHPGVHVERERVDELPEIAARVRDQADLELPAPQLPQDRGRVLVELEVRRVLPGLDDLERDGSHVRPLPAHAADDVLGEADPDLFVVLELRVVLEIVDGVRACVRIAVRVEDEPPTLARAPVALGAEQGPGLAEREVHVEEDGP
jgi:hypothetical protein